MITNRMYILASSSSSRKKILKNCSLKFIQVKPLCNEDKIKEKIDRKNKSPAYIAKKLSYEKAKSVSIIDKYRNNFIIGCDTLVYLNKKIFDKAKTMDQAKKKIKMLSGKKHKIISGITVCKDGKKIWQSSETTVVKIKKLNDKQITLYLRKTGKQILSSVGCYQIESLGPNIIESIKGDFFNVMGLPLFKLLNHISKHK